MHVNVQSAALSQRPVALPLRRPPLPRVNPGMEPFPPRARSQSWPMPGRIASETRAEQAAWLLLALSAGVLLFLSFWL